MFPVTSPGLPLFYRSEVVNSLPVVLTLHNNSISLIFFPFSRINPNPTLLCSLDKISNFQHNSIKSPYTENWMIFLIRDRRQTSFYAKWSNILFVAKPIIVYEANKTVGTTMKSVKRIDMTGDCFSMFLLEVSNAAKLWNLRVEQAENTLTGSLFYKHKSFTIELFPFM